ncbi:uncharacterized protein LOC129292029 isoform X1 [Prosopis cineraria]|uniref:uncharacterized protein LOC129292029 isoform X1 n=1 Tax=Prosopis cineraria TaxID=364024 RepID=UPI00240FB361|nr:uncharacterized protein LOC129292029 isoform X1 [Prosopis cineraria]
MALLMMSPLMTTFLFLYHTSSLSSLSKPNRGKYLLRNANISINGICRSVAQSYTVPFIGLLGFLGVVGGRLTLTENSDVIKMWVMKEYGVKSSWTHFFTVSTNPCHVDFFSPFCFTEDNQLIVRNITIGSLKLSAKEELQVVDHLNFFPRPMSFACASVYTEILLSVPSV